MRKINENIVNNHPRYLPPIRPWLAFPENRYSEPFYLRFASTCMGL